MRQISLRVFSAVRITTSNMKIMAETVEVKLMADRQMNSKRSMMRDELSAEAT
jgi:hypothetical protein